MTQPSAERPNLLALPEELPVAEEQGGAKRTTEPTRYGDWEIAGKCVDF